MLLALWPMSSSGQSAKTRAEIADAKRELDEGMQRERSRYWVNMVFWGVVPVGVAIVYVVLTRRRKPEATPSDSD